jgi:hypothetical protein
MASDLTASQESKHRGVSAYDLVRVLLGSVLLIAGVLKGLDTSVETATEGNTWTAHWLLVVFAIFEYLLGAWLIVGPQRSWKRQVALVYFTVLACVAAYGALSGKASCNCLGKTSVSPWYFLIFDVAAVIALVQLRPPASRCQILTSNALQATVLFAVSLTAGVCWTFSFGRPGVVNVVALAPGTWDGKRFPLLEHIQIEDRLDKGDWTVVLYRHDCPSCRAAIPHYEQEARHSGSRAGAPRIALVEVPPYGSLGIENLSSSQLPWVVGRLDDSRKWVISTPVEISLRNGVVLKALGPIRE